MNPLEAALGNKEMKWKVSFKNPAVFCSLYP